MVGFEFENSPVGTKNATHILDELTDDVFGTRDTIMETRREFIIKMKVIFKE